ncbi:hypothetical protein M413DRAFT_447115 [Hebeloma cylindrosporum]|uniref:Uncharacterized protein n=1 Tax=Hebeloma cylindrosporum TaxID=76867 RepID=A0A0C2XPW8_HEBCY|nr:hypothetical protein M413DRAFT_447115 [Hebeloma cylindrosporum h7]
MVSQSGVERNSINGPAISRLLYQREEGSLEHDSKLERLLERTKNSKASRREELETRGKD